MTPTNGNHPDRDPSRDAVERDPASRAERGDADLFAPLEDADELLFEAQLDGAIREAPPAGDFTTGVLTRCAARRGGCWLGAGGRAWLMTARVAVIGLMAGIASAAFFAQREAQPAPTPLTIETPATAPGLDLVPVTRMFRVADDRHPPTARRDGDSRRSIVPRAGQADRSQPSTGSLASRSHAVDVSELLAVLDGERLPELLVGGSSPLTGRPPIARRSYAISRWVVVEVHGGFLLLDERTGKLVRMPVSPEQPPEAR